MDSVGSAKPESKARERAAQAHRLRNYARFNASTQAFARNTTSVYSTRLESILCVRVGLDRMQLCR